MQNPTSAPGERSDYSVPMHGQFSNVNLQEMMENNQEAMVVEDGEFQRPKVSRLNSAAPGGIQQKLRN